MSIKILEKFEMDLYRVITAVSTFHMGYKFIVSDMSYVEIIIFGILLVIFAMHEKIL